MKSLEQNLFKTEYRSGIDNLIEDFYHTALEQSREYWRAVGFFSSSSFEAIGLPLANFVTNGGRMRLITSVRLEEEDYDAIKKGLDLRKVYESSLLKQIEREFILPVGRGTALLTYLLETERLDVRIALPRIGRGIYHEKVGIFLGNDNRFVAFSGSTNESRNALENNYECVDVFTSWEEPARANAKKEHFQQLWNGIAPGVETIDFPEAVKRQLVEKHQAQKSPKQDVQEIKDSSVWKHQDEAVAKFIDHERGILEMATGTGKTRTAIRICRYLIDNNLIETIIVAASGNDLLDQWYKHLLEITKKARNKLSVSRDYSDYREREMFLLSPRNALLLASRENLKHTLPRLNVEKGRKTILIHDEVHGLGSSGNRMNLSGKSEHIRYRLGLSATPDREYDNDGNVFIESHVGPVLYKFELADAIRLGILAPFDYHPIDYTPSQQDKARIRDVHRWAAAKRKNGEAVPAEQIQIRIASVYKTSLTKLAPFRKFIARNLDLLERCIVFVETKEYGDLVLEIIHAYRHDFHTYYGEEEVNTLHRFAKGDIECLITCHRLSEGIDIQSIRSVILFSSAKSRLETIQRIGRCLRIDPSNPQKIAHVVDFIRTQADPDEEDNSDQQRRTWLEEISKIRPIDGDN